ncbi:PP2C family protein-serine/threonine phosphatase [Puia sp.]|jgi:protein phosphatase|uniref:PP2C family protein-serine/threonine phosphatase n=1 Tax=Puia sp. TaxID=2045100 RepID=UPI002F3FE181
MRVTQIDYLHETGAKKNQEDFLWPLPGTASVQDRTFVVCDGVGGAENGEVASQFVAEWVARALQQTPPSEVGLPLINRLLEEARSRLVEHALLKGLGKDMATTFTLVHLMRDRVFVAWCGDSRVYHLRGNEILYRTTDHSLVHCLVRTGDISEEDARDHPQKNLLLKAIRADEPGPVAEGHWIRELRDGDYFLLCTDGLLENISDNDILFLLQHSEQREMYLAKAFRKYCYNKTRDNYSMYLIRVSPEPVEAPREKVTKSGGWRRIGWLLPLLGILVAAAAFVIRKNYFAPKREIQTVIPTAASAKDTLTP